MAHYIDPITNASYPFDERIWCSPERHPLMITPLNGITRHQIHQQERSLWRYQAALPVKIENPISLGEGCTPLVKQTIDGAICKLKLEWFAPTGSFKDRGTSVMLSFLRQQGISTVIEDSSGNGGSSVAGYAAAGGMKARIFVPASTQAAKVIQTRAYGAEVVLILGPREATEAAAIEAEAAGDFYASHNWHPFFLQGIKTLGYEIWEDLGFNVPNNIIIPAGAGSNVLGCYLAFKELVASREIQRMPKIFVTQPANCAPIHTSFQAGVDDYVSQDFQPTMAEGTAIKRPLRLKSILQALHETNGGTAAVEEADILSASLQLARQGFYVEPTCAHAVAGFTQLLNSGHIHKDDETVVIMTGTGLKAMSFYANQFE